MGAWTSRSTVTRGDWGLCSAPRFPNGHAPGRLLSMRPAETRHALARAQASQIAAQRAQSSSMMQMAGAVAGGVALQQHLAYSAHMAAAASGQVSALGSHPRLCVLI